MHSPTISVVVPLADHRGQTFACLASFLDQTLDDAEVEILVPAHGAEPELEAEVLAAFPRVRLLHLPGLNLAALYNAAAAEAAGEYLFIAEMHCIAERDCLEQAVRYAEREGRAGACARSHGINANSLAACEQRHRTADLEQWRTSGHGKVTTRGFLIKRRVWLQAGGFDQRYDNFSEVVLGRKLNELGYPVGYADRSVVHHFNQFQLGPLTQELTAYGYAECASYHCEPPADESLIFNEWKERERYTKSAIAWRRLVARVRLRWYQLVLRTAPARWDLYFAVYQRHWQTAVRLGRLNYLAAMAHGEQPQQAEATGVARQRQAA